MFFIAAKTIGFFALPSNLLFSLALLGIALMATRFARCGRVMLVGAVLVLAVLGLSPVGNWMIFPLEQRFPAWDPARGGPDGIVVLGGSISPENSASRGAPALNESAERLIVVAELARRHPAIPILFTGGSSSLLRPDGPTEAQFVRRIFESFGIAPERIVLEERSRDTFENATFTRDLVKPKPGSRWLLVTSAHHMPRAVGVFRMAGFPVEAYPVDWRTKGPGDLWTPFRTFASGLARTDAAAYEWVGLLTYWLSGRIPEILPGPRAS